MKGEKYGSYGTTTFNQRPRMLRGILYILWCVYFSQIRTLGPVQIPSLSQHRVNWEYSKVVRA